MAPCFWFTDLPAWGTYLSPHATGRFWSCSTFDWPKRCRLIRVEALWEVRFWVGIGFCHLRVELWKLAWHCFGVVFWGVVLMAFCLTLANYYELFLENHLSGFWSSIRDVKMCHARLQHASYRRMHWGQSTNSRSRKQLERSERSVIRSSFKMLSIRYISV